MRDRTSLSISLGRWSNLHVRIHAAFLLFAAIVFHQHWIQSRASLGGDATWWHTAIGLGILLLSVLLHELVHVWLAIRTGGGADHIILMPWGGMGTVRPPDAPTTEIKIHLAPAATHLAISVIMLAMLGLTQKYFNLFGLLNPLVPGLVFDPNGHIWFDIFQLTLWINWVLFLVNIIPAFPFDGGHALRAGICSAWPEFGRRRATHVVASVGKLGAAGLLVFTVINWSQTTVVWMPAWFATSILAIGLFFSARVEQEHAEIGEYDEDFFGYDFSQGYTSLERSVDPAHVPRPGLLAQWLDRRRESRLQRQRQVEADEERRADEILARLHRDGITSLTPDDRALLIRVGQRYRQTRDEA